MDLRGQMGQGECLGPYRIVALLGSGGMGEVYLAHDTRLDREVAVKILPRSFSGETSHASRFEREAKTLASLSHPNILAIHDYGQHGDFAYFVTERLEGMTLREHLASGPLSTRAAVRIGVQVAQGLAAAHEKGVVHRDLKPSNIFITRDGRIKILDFGLARFSEREKQFPSGNQSEAVTAECVTTPGTIIGTIGYMAPEQVRGRKADARSDVFSLGIILYEMLAGRRPFQGRSEADVLASILKEDPPSISQADAYVPPVLEGIVRRCLEKDPARRYASGSEVQRVLEAAAGEVSKYPTPAPRLARRSLLGPAVGGLFAVLAAAGVLLFFWLRAKPTQRPLPPFQPRQVTSLSGWSSQPAVSPDGMAVAFTVENSQGSDILVQDIRGGTPLRLTTGGSSRDPAWFPDGSAIAFTSFKEGQESIWKVPRFGGSPVLLVTSAREPAVSPGGRRIAFARVSPGRFSHIAVADLASPEDARVLTADKDGLWDQGHPAWSPDGKTLCYQDHNDLWLVPAGGGLARRLTHDDPVDRSPVWSPDGRHVYFSSSREETTAIWRIDVAGGRLDRVTTGSSSEQSPSLSRDGRCLVYDTQTNKMSGFIVDRHTGRRWSLPRSQYLGEPSIAPDGRDVAFCSNIEGRINLWRVHLKDGAPTGWPERLLETEGTCAHTAYSPDGRWIAYQLMLKGRRDVWVMPAGGGVPVRFTAVGDMNAQPEWSPDGGNISFISDRSGTYQVWAAPFRDGQRSGKTVQITRGREIQGSQTWSPRGDMIAYITEDTSGCDLWVAPVSGQSAVVRLTHRAGAQFAFWDRATGKILLSALWGGYHLTVKAVPPDGGAPVPVAYAAASDPRSDVMAIDASNDGRLFAIVERESEGEVWALQTQKGSF